MNDLAISLNLNLAACCLKVINYAGVKAFCIYVLEFGPINVKALFRRALASINLNFLAGAIEDLREVFRLDPKNYEMLRELRKVEGLLDKGLEDNNKGKRSMMSSLEHFTSGASRARGVVSSKRQYLSMVGGIKCCLQQSIGWPSKPTEKAQFDSLNLTSKIHSPMGERDLMEDAESQRKSLNLVAEWAKSSNMAEIPPQLSDLTFMTCMEDRADPSPTQFSVLPC